MEAFLIVVLLWGTIFLPGLGRPELQSEEGRRVLPAVTMLRTGDWLVPRVGGEVYYRKPPLLNWLVASSFLVTGRQDESSARLPSVLFLLAFVTLLVWLRGDWLRVEARLIGAVLFLTTLGVIDKGRQIEIEAVYLSLTAIAVLLWLNAWAGGRSRWRLWLVPSLFLGGGMLTKGPPILLFYYAPVVCTLAYARRSPELLSIPHAASLIVSLGLPVLWAYAAAQAAGAGRATTGLSSEMISRLLFSTVDWPLWAWHIVAAFGQFLPWVLFIPLWWRREFVDPIAPAHLSLFKGARLGLVAGFLAIMLIPGNGARYSLPVVGLGSVLLGWVLAEVGELPDRGRLWRSSAVVGYALVPLIATVGLIGVRRDLWAGILLGLVTGWTILLIRRRRFFDTPVRLTVLSGSLAAVLMLQYIVFAPPILARNERRRPIAARVNSLVPTGEPLYVYRPGYLDVLFYVRQPLEYVIEPTQIDARVRFLLVRDRVYRQFQKDPALAGRFGNTLCTFPHGSGGDFRLVELQKAGDAKAME